VRGVGALAPAGLEPAQVAEARQQHVQQPARGAAVDQPAAALAEHRVVEAGVLERQREGVRPVDPAPNRVGRLPVGEVLGELEDRHQGPPPGRRARAAVPGEQGGKRPILHERTSAPNSSRIRRYGLPPGNAARATRAVSSGT
jgi:hypothetical protein